jgi:hypothetical protein
MMVLPVLVVTTTPSLLRILKKMKTRINSYGYVDSFEWMLGSDIDCDLCGHSFNSLTLEFDNQYKDWSLSTRIGCYGSEKISLGDDKSVEDFLNMYLEFEGFDIVMKAEIQNIITKKEIEWGLI